MQLNKSCSSEPSGSNVPVAATRYRCALSNAQRSTQKHLTKRCQEISVDGVIHEECNDLTHDAWFVHRQALRPRPHFRLLQDQAWKDE